MHQDATSYGGRFQSRRLCVIWGPSPLPKKGPEPPIFGPCLLRPNGCMNQDATWHGGRPRPRRHCLRWGPSSTLPKEREELPPQFSAHVYCGQTAGWIKMALGMEMDVGAGHIVICGDPSPLPPKGTEPPPKFSAHFYCSHTV